MNQKCLIDTSILLRIILEKRKEIFENLVKNFQLYIPTNVLEEAMYKIIAWTFGELGMDMRHFSIKRAFKREVPDVLLKRILALNYFTKIASIISPDSLDFELSKMLALKYRLLPNDALILAICLRRDIKYLASFDEDFKKVGIIDVIDESYFGEKQ